MTATDKKLAEKAERERYLVLEMGVMEVRRKEKRETEKTRNSMVRKIGEIEENIMQMEVELEEKHMVIEDMGQNILELQMDIESGEISEEQRKVEEDKKTDMEKQKKEWVDAFQKKKDTMTWLAEKKIKLQRQTGIIEEYLAKYRKEVRQKEVWALVELVHVTIINIFYFYYRIKMARVGKVMERR